MHQALHQTHKCTYMDFPDSKFMLRFSKNPKFQKMQNINIFEFVGKTKTEVL